VRETFSDNKISLSDIGLSILSILLILAAVFAVHAWISTGEFPLRRSGEVSGGYGIEY
jgi:hypothetical protein